MNTMKSKGKTTMFKRNKPPNKITIDAFINYRDQRVFHATAEQIAEDGIFLNTKILSIPINTTINLKLFIGQKSYNIPAVIIDDCSQGLYVGFYKLQTDAYQTFCNLQHSAHITPRLPSAA